MCPVYLVTGAVVVVGGISKDDRPMTGIKPNSTCRVLVRKILYKYKIFSYNNRPAKSLKPKRVYGVVTLLLIIISQLIPVNIWDVPVSVSLT